MQDMQYCQHQAHSIVSFRKRCLKITQGDNRCMYVCECAHHIHDLGQKDYFRLTISAVLIATEPTRILKP